MKMLPPRPRPGDDKWWPLIILAVAFVCLITFVLIVTLAPAQSACEPPRTGEFFERLGQAESRVRQQASTDDLIAKYQRELDEAEQALKQLRAQQ